MSPLRVWIESTPSESLNEIALPVEETTHLVRSLRARRGDAVTLLNGEGLILEGTLIQTEGKHALVAITQRHQAPPPKVKITLVQAMTKAGTMDDLIRTACETGASVIIPLETAHGEVKLSADRAQSKLQRWHQQTIEACKQSGNPWRTQVLAPQSFKTWLNQLPPSSAHECRLTGSLEPDAVAVGKINFQGVKSVTWLIGPEGDFSAEELALARQASFQPVSLGPTVLRAENAALACLVATHVLTQRTLGN
jgi:16S rRNA (uracil1498-N3)-methyltransferase